MADLVVNLGTNMKEFLSFCQERKWLLGATFSGLLLAYGYAISNFSVSMDNEIYLNGNVAIGGWVAQGRFGIAMLKWLGLGQKIVPFFNMFIAVVLLGISSFVWCYGFAGALPKVSETSLIIFSLLFCTFPSHAHYLCFYSFNIEISIGWIAAAAGTRVAFQWAVHKSVFGRFLVAMGLMTFAIAAYQPFGIVCAMGLATVMLLRMASEKDHASMAEGHGNLAVAAKIALVLLCSAACYKVADLFLKIFWPSSGYVEGFVRWGTFEKIQIFVWFRQHLTALLLGYDHMGTEIILPTLVLGAVLEAVITSKWTQGTAKAFSLFSVLLLCAAPAILPLIIGGPAPLRAQLVIPISVGALWMLATEFAASRIFRQLLITAAVVFSLSQARHISCLYYGNQVKWEQDSAMSNRIAERISIMTGTESPAQPVIILGAHFVKEEPFLPISEHLGYSIYQAGNPHRNQHVMRLLGHDYQPFSSEQLQFAKSHFTKMASWPNKESIVMENGVIIVKLSSNSGYE